MNDRMFDLNSFDDLKDASEVKASVAYLAHNEVKFRQELASEGLSYDEIQKTLAQIWTSLLKLASKYKYSDYLVSAKKELYKVK